MTYLKLFSITFMNRQDACSTKSNFSCGTGILPVADNDAHLTAVIEPFSITFMNRQDACSTKSKFSCGTGILPVADNDAISQFSLN